MARRLTLHIGAQKTGSTALHHHLARNAALLDGRLTVRMPAKGTPMREMGWGAVQYSLDPTPERAATLRLAARAVRDGLPEDDLPVLISHENLVGAMPGNRGTTALFPRATDVLALVLPEFDGFDIRVVLYTREMASWRRSVWGQAVHSDGYTGDFPAFEAEMADLGPWDGVTARLAAQLGPRFTALRLEDEGDPTRPGSALLALAGLDADTRALLEPSPRRANAALSPAALEFIRLVNALDLPFRARSQVADLAARHQRLFAAEPQARAR